jgi:hypothetical protein
MRPTVFLVALVGFATVAAVGCRGRSSFALENVSFTAGADEEVVLEGNLRNTSGSEVRFDLVRVAFIDADSDACWGLLMRHGQELVVLPSPQSMRSPPPVSVGSEPMILAAAQALPLQVPTANCRFETRRTPRHVSVEVLAEGRPLGATLTESVPDRLYIGVRAIVVPYSK